MMHANPRPSIEELTARFDLLDSKAAELMRALPVADRLEIRNALGAAHRKTASLWLVTS